MLETLVLTFALLVAGASARAWVFPLFKAFSGRMNNWLAVKASNDPSEIAMKQFLEAERNLEETRRGLLSP